MPLIKFRNVLSCSSEDKVHCAENLLKPEQYKKWLSAKGNDEKIICILELEKSSLISSVDIGNDGCAFVELLVSRLSSTKPDDWSVLLPATLLMTPSESRSNTNRNQVKLLKSSDLNKSCVNEKWDRLKIVCEQKFNRLDRFGLSFIKLNSLSPTDDETGPSESANRSSIINRKEEDDDDDDDETGEEQNKIGSFFAKMQAEKQTKVSKTSASDQIRALSTVADEVLSRKSMNDNEIQTLLKKDVKNVPNRLSKRRISDEAESSTNDHEIKRSKNIDKSQIMKKTVFVLSGFQNPLRSELRTKATKMGATYSDDWDETCTHLICAFPNTPKFTQVKQARQGLIVSKEWILDCDKQNKLLPEKNYELKGSMNTNNTKSDRPNRTSEKPLAKATSSNNNKEEHKLTDDTKKTASPSKKIQTFDDDDEDCTEPTNIQNAKHKPETKTKMKTFDDDDTEDEEPMVSKDVTKKTATSTVDDVFVSIINNYEILLTLFLLVLSVNTYWTVLLQDLSLRVTNSIIYNAETDDDEPNTTKTSIDLANFFNGKHFYIFKDDFNDDTFRDIRRVIYAYDGVLEKQMAPDVKYVITSRMWNSDFEKASKTSPDVKFLSIGWLQDCHDENTFVPCQPYLIVP